MPKFTKIVKGAESLPPVQRALDIPVVKSDEQAALETTSGVADFLLEREMQKEEIRTRGAIANFENEQTQKFLEFKNLLDTNPEQSNAVMRAFAEQQVQEREKLLGTFTKANVDKFGVSVLDYTDGMLVRAKDEQVKSDQRFELFRVDEQANRIVATGVDDIEQFYIALDKLGEHYDNPIVNSNIPELVRENAFDKKRGEMAEGVILKALQTEPFDSAEEVEQFVTTIGRAGGLDEDTIRRFVNTGTSKAGANKSAAFSSRKQRSIIAGVMFSPDQLAGAKGAPLKDGEYEQYVFDFNKGNAQGWAESTVTQQPIEDSQRLYENLKMQGDPRSPALLEAIEDHKKNLVKDPVAVSDPAVNAKLPTVEDPTDAEVFGRNMIRDSLTINEQTRNGTPPNSVAVMRAADRKQLVSDITTGIEAGQADITIKALQRVFVEHPTTAATVFKNAIKEDGLPASARSTFLFKDQEASLGLYAQSMAAFKSKDNLKTAMGQDNFSELQSEISERVEETFGNSLNSDLVNGQSLKTHFVDALTMMVGEKLRQNKVDLNEDLDFDATFFAGKEEDTLNAVFKDAVGNRWGTISQADRDVAIPTSFRRITTDGTVKNVSGYTMESVDLGAGILFRGLDPDRVYLEGDDPDNPITDEDRARFAALIRPDQQTIGPLLLGGSSQPVPGQTVLSSADLDEGINAFKNMTIEFDPSIQSFKAKIRISDGESFKFATLRWANPDGSAGDVITHSLSAAVDAGLWYQETGRVDSMLKATMPDNFRPDLSDKLASFLDNSVDKLSVALGGTTDEDDYERERKKLFTNTTAQVLQPLPKQQQGESDAQFTKRLDEFFKQFGKK